MAKTMLAEDVKYKVIFALCYTGTVLDPNSVNFNSIVRDRLNIDNFYIEERVTVLLSKIESIKSLLENSPTKNNVKRIGDIELDTENGRDLITKEYARLLDELSKLLDLPSMCKAGGGRNVPVCL